MSSLPARPLVSVVVIFLDAERFLAEALESIATQTWDAWEVLLVDDGSTDGSAAVASAFVERFPERAQLLTHPGGVNRGMSASRNVGLDAARGDLVAFLDADDVWLPNKLDHQIELLRAHPDAGLVYGPTEYWYGWTGDAADRARDAVGRLGVETGRVIDPPELLVRSLESHGGILPGICGLLIRREALDRAGRFEEAFRGSYEDQVFFTKLFRWTPTVATPVCTDRYRQHPDSCCAVALRTGEYHPEAPHPARERFLTWLDDYLDAHPLPPAHPARARLDRALAQEWEPYRHPMRYRLRRAEEAATRLPGRIKRFAGRRARSLPAPLRDALRARFREGRFVPPRRLARLGSLGKLAPISRDFGYERGTPIDRYYIERFLARHAGDIRGRVLEVGDATYVERFGGERIESIDVLHVDPKASHATIVGDLAHVPQIADATYDCIVLTQTLQYVYDLRAAVATLHRILAPGGVVLATAPGLTPIVRCDWEDDWYWGLTRASARALFQERFPEGALEIETPGNVVSTTAFLQGLAAEELSRKKLEHDDRDYQLLVTVRAERPTEDTPRAMAGRWNYADREQASYGDDTTYRIGMDFLDAPGRTIEDWGCGLGYARRFVEHGTYVGVDGSPSEWTDRVADLTTYRGAADCVFMRHVIEHNHDWARVLDGALASFRHRMALILFTPFVPETRAIAYETGIPDMAFRREDVTSRFPDDVVVVSEEQYATDTQYGTECVFLLERREEP